MGIIKHLKWDSEFFGFKIGRYEKELFEPGDEASFLAEREKGGYDCVYLFLDPNDPKGLEVAARNRFFLADIRMIYRLNGDGQSVAMDQRCSLLKKREDREKITGQLKDLAGGMAIVSRFYRDKWFRPKAAEMYQLWIDKILNDPQGEVVVIGDGKTKNEVCGFTAVTLSEGNHGDVVLVAIDPKCAGQGLGQIVVNNAVGWLRQNGAKEIFVRTQHTNISAMNLYQKVGFRPSCVQLIYHAWKEV